MRGKRVIISSFRPRSQKRNWLARPEVATLRRADASPLPAARVDTACDDKALVTPAIATLRIVIVQTQWAAFDGIRINKPVITTDDATTATA